MLAATTTADELLLREGLTRDYPSPPITGERDRRLWQKVAAVNRAEDSGPTRESIARRQRTTSKGSASDAARRHRSCLHWTAKTEQRLEDRNRVRRGHRTALTGRHRFLLALALLRWLDHATLGFDRRERAAVDIVDIAPDLQLTGFVDERTRTGRQTRSSGCSAQASRTSIRRILDAHATMAVRAHIMREQVLVRRVVLIDQEPIGKIEPYAS